MRCAQHTQDHMHRMLPHAAWGGMAARQGGAHTHKPHTHTHANTHLLGHGSVDATAFASVLQPAWAGKGRSSIRRSVHTHKTTCTCLGALAVGRAACCPMLQQGAACIWEHDRP
jgi:hypothetical protein